MSTQNKLHNKRARREEREARKTAFHAEYQRRKNLPAFEPEVNIEPFNDKFYWSDAEGNEVDGPELGPEELEDLAKTGNAAITENGEVIAILRTREEQKPESGLVVAESVLWTPGSEG